MTPEVREFMASMGFSVMEIPTPHGYCYTHSNFQFGDFITENQATFFYNQFRLRELKARKDEREGMQFFDQKTGEETHTPYLQYRFTGDGLKLSWEDRTKELEADLNNQISKLEGGENE